MEQQTGAVQRGPREYKMFIGGAWRAARSGASIESLDPATEEVIAHVPQADEADVADAVAGAHEGFAQWRRFGWKKRQKLLLELATRMEERIEHFAKLDAIDSGNPISGMRQDAQKAPDEIRYFANLASELKGTSFEAPEDVVCFSTREPYGIVGRIIPFNHPYRFAAKVAPGLAAGNAVILKPGETTSLSALEFAEMTIDLLPPGVLTVLTGSGHVTGGAIVRHPDIPRIAFTGSVPTGVAIMREGATHLKRLSLELGGKNPMIVFPDVDIDKAVNGCIKGMNLARSMGQSCQSNSRVFVHADIHGRFLETLVRCVSDLKIGDPCDEGTMIGPVNHRKHYERIMDFIAAGKAEGAELACGGGRPAGRARGYFVEPTIFAGVSMDMRIAREEIFGPVVSVLSWRDLDDVIAQANGTAYGLTANIWTNDLSLAHRTAKAMESGLVWINGAGGRVPGVPFGGYKTSGLGKEGDLSDLFSYTQEKTIITHLL